MQSIPKTKNVALIGMNEESAHILSCLLQTGGFNILKIFNPEVERISDLSSYEHLDLIIDTTNDPEISSELKNLDLKTIDILSGISAQLLYCTGLDEIRIGDFEGYRNKIFNNLKEIRRSVFLSKNKEELLKLVLSIATRTLKADSGSIMLVDSQKKALSIEMASGLEPKIVNSTVQKLSSGIAGKVVKSQRPLLIQGNLVEMKGSGRNELTSAICVPIIIGKEVIGVININSKKPSRIFDDFDLAFLKQLTDFTADIIKSSKEFEQTSSSSSSLILLMRVRDILNLNYSIEERLNLLLMKIANTFNAEICNYYSLNKESGMFLVKASSSFNLAMLKGRAIKLNDFFASKVLRTKNSFSFFMQTGTGNLKKWYIAQPVKADNEIVGLLFIHLITGHNDLTSVKNSFEKIASLLGTEFAKTRSIVASKNKAVKYSAISEITFDLARINNIRQLSKMIVSNACLILETECSILSLYNRVMNSFEILDSFSIASSSHLEKISKLDGTIALKTMSEASVLLIPDLFKEGYVSEEIPTRSVLSYCIRRNGQPIASISIYDKTTLDLYDRRCFADEDKEVFVRFCLQVSKALERFIVVNPNTFTSKG